MNGKTIVFKMINGEEIIAKVFNSYDASYELESPATIVLQPTASGSMGVGIAPYMPYAEGKVTLNKSAIAAFCEPAKSLQSEYNRVFGSGIEIAPASVLAGLK
jgi:hypothetical protein